MPIPSILVRPAASRSYDGSSGKSRTSFAPRVGAAAGDDNCCAVRSKFVITTSGWIIRPRKIDGAQLQLSGLTIARGAGEMLRLFSCARQRHCFIDTFLLLELGLGVGDYA